MNEFILQEVTPAELSTDVQEVLGSTSGRLLRFKNAILARAEVNANNDELTEQGLAEVAASLPLTPIDIEHNKRQICGYYIGAHMSDGALYTDGVIFSERFPEVAAGMQAMPPQYRQSIEAVAEEAECSKCGGVFVSVSQYCEHLLSKRATGAVRKLRSMKALGGAVTKNPAGTQTEFDPSQMTIIASLAADAKELSSEQREELSDDAYALIQEKDGEKVRRFPINDRVHAAQALRMLDRAKGLSDDERAQVRRKAEAKLKELGGEHDAKGAAQRVIAAINADLFALNPHGGTPLLSPVFYPTYWFPPIQIKVAEKKAEPMTLAASQEDFEATKAEWAKTVKVLEEQVQALEAKLQAKPTVTKAKLGMAAIALGNLQQTTEAPLRVLPR